MVPEADRAYDLAQAEIGSWMGNAETVIGNVLKANPKDIAEQYEKQISEMKEAYSETIMELKF